jgi:3-deoxy-manno-octulosonate cytidylyltransferase (CMP-KDO synthetase)
MKKKVLGVIPARFQSSRFPGKPLAKILGKTLIQRTYENALACNLLEALVVATDDSRIYDHVLSFGGQAVMTSSACATGSDRIIDAIVENSQFDDFDIIVNIQGDEPCIEPDVIAKVIDALITQEISSMSSAVMKIITEEEAFDPSIVKCVFDKDGYALYFSRQLIPAGKTGGFKPHITYYRHLGIYAFKRNFLLKYANLSETPLQKEEDLEQLKVLEHGFKIKLVVVNSASLGVDNPEDIKKVEALLCKQNSFL